MTAFDSPWALYYPTIQIDPTWLKQALLYWDGVHRIVPWAPWEDNNTTVDFKIALENGLVEDLPAREYRDQAGDEFLDSLEMTSLQGFAQDSSLAVITELDLPGGSYCEERFEVFTEKMPYRVLDRLMHLGSRFENTSVSSLKLPRQLRHLFREFPLHCSRSLDTVELPIPVAALYMFTLASVIAKRTRMSAVTDSTIASSLFERFLYSETQAVDTYESAMTTESVHPLLEFRFGLPTAQELEHVSMEQVLQFRASTRDERTRCRQVIESWVGEIAGFDDQAAIGDFLAEKGRLVERDISDYRQAVELSFVSVADAAIKLSISGPGLGALTHFIGVEPVGQITIGGFTLAVGALKLFCDRRAKLVDAKSRYPLHYLNLVQKHF